MSTAKISVPISGDKAYQVRARAALPLLVRQAEAGATVFYSDLAEELGLPNSRVLKRWAIPRQADYFTIEAKNYDIQNKKTLLRTFRS